jgi:hypothetical protein
MIIPSRTRSSSARARSDADKGAFDLPRVGALRDSSQSVSVGRFLRDARQCFSYPTIQWRDPMIGWRRTFMWVDPLLRREALLQ